MIERKRIKNRRDNAQNWTTDNPVLMAGEFGVELDTKRIKVGDGTTAWNDLPYCTATSEEITEIVESITYDKTEIDNALNAKADAADVYTKTEVDDIKTTIEGEIPTDTSDLTNGAGYITINDVPAQVQADWTEADSTSPAFIKNKPSIPSGQVQADWNQADSSAVDYIKNKPSIPSGQVQSDWNQTNQAEVDFIKNKPSIPTTTSDLQNDSGYITLSDVPAQEQSDWNQSDSSAVDYIKNKPTIPASPVQSDWNEVDSSSLAYIANKPSIPSAQVNSDWNAVSGVAQILNKPAIPTDTTDLTNGAGYITLNDVPAQEQADWNESDSSDPAYIQNKPTIYPQWFGTQQEYDAILIKDPDTVYHIEGSCQIQSDWNQSDSTAVDYIKNKPSIPSAQVNADWNAVSGVAQILNKPAIPTDTTDLTNGAGYITLNDVPAQVNADWNSNSGASEILNKPSIPTATSDLQNDSGYITLNDVPAQEQADWNESDSSAPTYIKNKPTIPAAQVQSDWNAVSGVAQILNKPSIPSATSDLQNDSGYITISDVPAQVNADWNSNSGASQILNKPTIPANTSDLTNDSGYITISDVPAQAQSDWNQGDSSAVDYIKNKPIIPTVNDGTFTIQKNGTTVASFTANDNSNKTANITVPVNTSDLTNDSGFITISDVPAQVNADWNAVSGVAQILNKPSMSTETLTFTLQGGTTQTITVYIQPSI